MYVSAGSRTNHSPGTRATHVLEQRTIDAGREPLVRLKDRAGAWQQHVLGDLGNARVACSAGLSPPCWR